MKWVVGGACLIAVAASEMVIAAVGGTFSGSPQQVLSSVAANVTGTRAGLYLAVLLAILLVPGVLPTLELATQKGRNGIYVGACLLLVGAFGHAILGAGALPLLALAAPDRDRAQMTALVQPISVEPLAIGLVLLLVAFIGGLVWLIGLVRAKWIELWVLGVYILWFLAQSLGRPLMGLSAGRLLSELPFAITFAWVGITMIRRKSKPISA